MERLIGIVNPWSYEEGFEAFKTFVGLDHADDLAPEDFQPFPLPSSLGLIRSALPSTAKRQAETVFLGAASERKANAVAIAASESTRFAVVYAGLTYATLAFSTMYERFQPLFVDRWGRHPRESAPHDRLWARAEEVGRDIERSFDEDEVVKQCEIWMAQWSTDDITLPSPQLRALLPPPDWPLPMSAITFVTAHELAHHLLGHTDVEGRREDPARYPAAGVLKEEKSERGIEQSATLNPAQHAELDADLFAFLCLAGAFNRDDTMIGSDVARWYLGTSGAFVALTALDLAARHHGEPWTAQPALAGDGPTHPSLNLRIEQVVDAALSCGYEDGSAIDESGTPMPHPIAVAIQLAAARLVIGVPIG